MDDISCPAVIFLYRPSTTVKGRVVGCNHRLPVYCDIPNPGVTGGVSGETGGSSTADPGATSPGGDGVGSNIAIIAGMYHIVGTLQ